MAEHLHKLIFHRELKSIQYICGYIGTSHECIQEFKGKIIFVPWPKNCDVCKNGKARKEYNFERWSTNVDGYLVCGSCNDKLGCEPICEDCFCRVCYSSLEEFCFCSEE